MRVQLRRGSLWAIGASLAGGLAALGAIMPFPASSLGEEISRRAESRLGIDVDAGSTTLSLTRGLALHDVTARVSTNGLDVSARIERVVAVPNFTIRGPRHIEALRLIRPTVTVVVGERPADRRTPASVPAPAPRESATPDADVEVSEPTDLSFGGVEGLHIELSLADLEVRSPETNALPFRAVGVNINLEAVSHNLSASSLLHGLAGHGTMTSRELWIGPVVVVDVASPVTLGGGHFHLPALTFWCSDRNLLLRDVDIDFTTEPFVLGTPGTVSERRRTDQAASAEWVPIGPFSELDRLCSS